MFFHPKKVFFWGIIGLIFIGCAILFGVYDLQISVSMYNPNSTFGTIGEVIGEWPNSFAIIFSGIVFFHQKKNRGFVRFFSLLLAWLGVFILIFWTYLHLVGVFPPLVVGLFLSAIMTIALVLLSFLVQPESYRRLLDVAVTALISAALVIVVINLIKFFWGRVRFRDMFPSLESFTPWYLPQGVTGEHSFPSAHTANAASSCLLWYLIPKVSAKWKKVIFLLIPILWTGGVAVSRIIVGAHFASDVLFGAVLSFGIWYIVFKIVHKKMAGICL